MECVCEQCQDQLCVLVLNTRYAAESLQDCKCADVVVTVLGHGKAKAGQQHKIVYKDQYTRGGEKYKKRVELLWQDVLAAIFKAFTAEAKDCLKLQFVLSECYSGAAWFDVEEVRGKVAPKREEGSVTGISGASGTQKCWGRQPSSHLSSPTASVYFVDAFVECLRLLQYKSISAAWRCIQERTEALAEGHRDKNGKSDPKEQTPMTFP